MHPVDDILLDILLVSTHHFDVDFFWFCWVWHRCFLANVVVLVVAFVSKYARACLVSSALGLFISLLLRSFYVFVAFNGITLFLLLLLHYFVCLCHALHMSWVSKLVLMRTSSHHDAHILSS